MLGAGSWFVGLAIPTVFVGGFIASRKRLAYQWREELMDPDNTVYPPITMNDMDFFRGVSPSYQKEGSGVTLAVNENIGLYVNRDVLSVEERNVLMDEVVRWVSLFGQKIDPRKFDFYENKNNKNKENSNDVDLKCYKETSIISDHAEDIQLMKAPWGTGDRIRYEAMPATLRFLVDKVQRTFEGVGRLRHVYVEYSPSGKFYHEPRATKGFDGHDYVIIPLRSDTNPTVVTFSPLLRSKVSILQEVQENSWTSRDIDAIIPSNAALRVYGTARYEWGWGIRPCEVWFGHRQNTLKHLLNTTFVHRGMMERVKRRLLYMKPKHTVQQDAALVVLHFEGPRDNNKQRSLLLQPEILIFGRPPAPEMYEQWVEDRPTQEVVRKEGVFLFMIKNYLEMLQVS
ncbi:uncharacterized protein TM35_000043800 [Trypanosoma theileri]|uniref:Uncharacterized protein n=1 Tax=Trypanosoma theileri TaxID=67003 RepID=A0A1X0P5E8_9TRYP|nr:uncharacterized protein TM35_000043800 [Trypanosoma theileri]ORC92166.1 hypothetical protein TM35_000043800 [Trypanosoma theileri]